MKNPKNPANPADTEAHTRTARPSFWLRAIDHRKHKLTHEYRKSLGDSARDGISDEDYATTVTTLEKMARNLGWDESQRRELPFGRSHGRGFPRGAGHPAMMHGFGPHRDGEQHHDHGHRRGRDRRPTETPES